MKSILKWFDMTRQFLRWTLIGLLIRLLIMPFSFHGHDIFFIYYSPFKFITQGAWDPYLFIRQHFPGAVNNPYFPPGLFFIISGFLYFLKGFLPNIASLFSVFETWNFAWQGNTIHFAQIFLPHQLFRTLFFLKVPYLFFDFGSGWILYKLLQKDKDKAIFAYKVWIFNPFVLHSCYALGQSDIMSTFFVMAAVYFLYLNKKYFSVVALAVGFMVKTIPVLLVPFIVLLSSANFRERLKLSCVFLMSSIILIFPFYLSSNNAVVEAIFFSGASISTDRQALFLVGYLLIMLAFFFVEKIEFLNLDLLISGLSSVLLLFFAFYNVTIRYFILVTPLLVYIAVKDKKFWFYLAIFFVSLFELRTGGNTLQWGLFSALHPEFFSSLPIADSYINLLINVKYIHQFMYRLFVVTCLVMIAHLIIVNRQRFKLSFKSEK